MNINYDDGCSLYELISDPFELVNILDASSLNDQAKSMWIQLTQYVSENVNYHSESTLLPYFDQGFCSFDDELGGTWKNEIDIRPYSGCRCGSGTIDW